MFYILTILVVGLSGIVAQVLLLRELLVSFYGNELTLGIILANWIIAEALGVFIIGKFIDRVKNKINIFIILQIIFSLMLPLSIYLSRTFKILWGIPVGEGIGLYTIFYASFFIILPTSFCHGALFSCACKIYSLHVKESAGSIGKVYSWETIGTIIGGIILTYLFIPYLNSFQIVFVISVSNLIICLFFSRSITKILRYIVLFLIFIIGYLSLSSSINYIHRLSIIRQWRGQQILDYRNSVYGNIAVTKKEKQYTFFYNGIPIITTPHPDITFVQEFGNLPLLFHSHPSDILIISGGAGGLINEVLKHPISKVDYAELDPLIIEMLKKYPSVLSQKELTDKRVNIINLDGRFFVKYTSNQYDIVLIGLSRPLDLTINRLFTQEFFSLVKKRLKHGGILAFCLPGSLTYLSQELKDINACILGGLKKTFGSVKIIPGDYNMFINSSSREIMGIDAALISARISQRHVKTDILIPSYLEYRLNKRWIEWFKQSLVGATRKINQDFLPFAVFQMLILWNKQFSPPIANIFASLKNLNLMPFLILILAITGVLFTIFYRKRTLARLTVAYSIVTTGFFGMLVNLILIFSFQVVYGYLYYRIGILMSIFMAGIAMGSILMTRGMERNKNSVGLFIKLEALIVIFSYVLAWIIARLAGYAYYTYLIFTTLFFIVGLLVGLEFPLASKLYLREKERIGETAGLLYFSDLMGGWLAGMLGGVLFLPVLGVFNSCMVIILLKLSSLFLIGIFSKRLTPPFIQS